MIEAFFGTKSYTICSLGSRTECVDDDVQSNVDHCAKRSVSPDDNLENDDNVSILMRLTIKSFRRLQSSENLSMFIKSSVT